MKLSNQQLKTICQKTKLLCKQKHFDLAKKNWRKLKSFRQYYTYVRQDFLFKNSMIIDRDINLIYPIIIKINSGQPIKLRGIMNHH